jgi:hypothetical protein
MSVTTRLTPGTPKTGLWCNTCLLPSRVEVSIYVLGEAGPFVIATLNRCDECGVSAGGTCESAGGS